MPLEVGTIRGLLVLDDQWSKTLQKTAAETTKTLDSFSSKAASAGVSMSAGLTLPIVGIGVAAVKAGSEFEKSMNGIKGVLQATSSEMDLARATSLQLGADTVFSAKDAADAMLELGKAGFTTKDAIGSAGKVMELAAASGMSMSESAEMAARTMNMFGMEAKDLGHINDVLATAVNKSSLEMHDLQVALPYVGSAAANLGVSIEDVSAMLALMRDNGTQAETAGRAMREMFDKLLNPVKATRDGLAQMNLTVEDFRGADGKLKPFDQIVSLLGEHAGDTGAMMKAFGDIAGIAIPAALKNGTPKFFELSAAMKHSEGSAKTLAEAMMHGLPGSIEQLKGSVDTLFIKLSKALEPAVLGVLDALTKTVNYIGGPVLDTFGKMPVPLQIAVGAMLAIAAAAGPLLLALAGIAKAVSIMVSGWVAYQTISFAISNSIPVLTARLWLMDAAGGALSLTLSGLGLAAGIAGAAFAGWNVGKWLGDLKLFSGEVQTLSERVEVTGIRWKDWWNNTKTSDADIVAILRLNRGLKETADTVAQVGEESNKVKFGPPEDFEATAAAANKAAKAIAQAQAQTAEMEKETQRLKDLYEKWTGIDKMKEFSDVLKVLDIDITTLGKQQRDQLHSLAEEAIDAAIRTGQEVPTAWMNIWESTLKAADGVQVYIDALDRAKQESINLSKTNPIKDQPFNDALWKGVIGEKSAHAAAGGFLDSMKEILGGTKGGVMGIAETVTGAFSNAFEGGGGVGGAVKSISTKVLSKALNFVPLVGPILSNFAGPLVAGFGKIFGGLFGGGEGKKVLEERDAWMKKFTGIDDLGKAQDAMRKLATEAGATDVQVRALFDSKKMEPFHKAQEDIIGLIDKQKKATEDLLALTDAQTTRQKMLDDAVQRWGFEISELGPLMQKQRLAEQAEGLLTDWQLLTESGIDIATVARRMSEGIEEFYLNAVKTGTEIPDKFKPILQSMVDQGLLVDENGTKVTDLAKANIKWGSSLEDMFKGVLQKLDALITKLTEAQTAVTSIPTTRTIDIVARRSGDWEAPEWMRGQGVDQMHIGGVIRAHGGLAVDEVPIIAQTGEGILSRKGMNRLGGAAALNNLNAGAMQGASSSRPIEITVISQLDGRQVGKSVVRAMPDMLTLYGVKG